MKKLFTLCLTAVLMLTCLTSCSLFTYKKNQWFSEEKLTECIVPDMPQLDSDFVRESDKIIYANLSEDEFDNYLNEIYAYLKSKNFEHLGTRGEVASSLSGAFVTYYLEPATELSEFNLYSNTYKFVYSDGKISMSIDENPDDFTFCILTIGHYESTQTLEYGIRKFDYNTTISLKFNSEAPLSGRYTLKDDHEHTYQNYHDDIGHGWSYTCGCKTPPNFTQHFDGDGNGLCDSCSYQMVSEGNHFIRNQAGCEWLNEISAENIAEIKIISGAVGVAPGNLNNISSSTDESVIARIFEEYYQLDTRPISKMEGQIDGGSGVTVKFILKNGAIKELYINNGNYRDTNGNYFELNNTPKFNDTDSKTKAYGFITYTEMGTVYNGNNISVCEIPTFEFEFVELTGGFDDSSAKQKYCVETEFGNLVFFSDTVFYIDYPVEGHTDFCVLVGKTLDELIAEYSATEE